MDSAHELVARIASAISELEAVKASLVTGNIQIASEPPATADKLRERICLQCHLKITAKQRAVRGCHDYCAKEVKAIIESGIVNEQKAVAAGMIAAKRVTGRPRKRTLAIHEYVATLNESVEDVAQAADAAANRRAAQRTRKSKPKPAKSYGNPQP